jgi:Flp pilus assembly pilin Flp
MLYWYLRIRNWLADQRGQDLAEYALLIGLIALAAVAGVTVLGNGISNTMNAIAGEVQSWAVP